MVKYVIKNFLSVFLIIATTLFFKNKCMATQTSPNVFYNNATMDLEESFEKRLAEAHADLERAYYDLLKRGHFDSPNYNNNRVIDTFFSSDQTLSDNVAKEGTILLTLINHLEKQSDRYSRMLLDKINELFYLQFHEFLSKLQLKKRLAPEILSIAADLYEQSIPTPQGPNHHFRSLLSATMILIITTNNAPTENYEAKQKSFTIKLNIIRQRMLSYNHRNDLCKVSEKAINDLFNAIIPHAIAEPLVKQHTIIKACTYTALFFVAAFLFKKYALAEVDFEEVDDEGNPTNNKLRKSFITTLMTYAAREINFSFLRPLLRGSFKFVITEIAKAVKDTNLVEQVTQSATSGAANTAYARGSWLTRLFLRKEQAVSGPSPDTSVSLSTSSPTSSINVSPAAASSSNNNATALTGNKIDKKKSRWREWLSLTSWLGAYQAYNVDPDDEEDA